MRAGEFAPLLRDLVRQTASGRLEITTAEGVRSVWLESGNVRAVISEIEEEKLGRWLVSRGRLEAHRMALSLLRQPDGVRFGRFLVDEGLLQPEELAQELQELAMSALGWLLVSDGSYSLFGEELPLDVTTLQMTTASLLVKAVRTLSAEDLAGTFLTRSDFLVTLEDTLGWGDGATLSPQEAYLYTRIDGASTLGQLCRLTPLAPDECLRAAAALMAAGLVERRDKAVERAESVIPDSAAPEPDEALMEFSAEERQEYDEVLRLAEELPHMDYYRRLSLAPGATLDQINTRFRELLRRYHVERVQEPHLRLLRRELETIQTALQDSFNTLGYTERRARYDELLKQGKEGCEEDPEAAHRREMARNELVSANVDRAKQLIKAGEFGAAIQLLDQAVRFDPQPEVLLMLAKLELRNPMWAQRGLNHLRLAVSVEPELTEAWWELAKFWGRRREFNRQSQCLAKVLEQDPENVEARNMVADLKRRPGRK